MLTILLLIACRANDASDLLDYPTELEVTLTDSDDQEQVDWTVEARHDLELIPTTDMCEGLGGGVAGEGLEAGFHCSDFDDGRRTLGHGDTVTFTLIVDGYGDQADQQPANQLVDIPFDVAPCRAFGDCSPRYSLGGTVDIAVTMAGL